MRIVFDKYVYEGYGPQHIATYLNNSGYRARSGKCWHPSSIRGMVQNLTYTGVLRCGDARSELMPDLQIVPQEQFENAQRIRNERSVRSTAEAENRLPLNIHGKSLLAGNAYCGHCGAKLELTSSRKWRKMADGSLDDTLRIRYTCYGKLRKQTNCTGQTGYTVHILDEIIDKAVRQIFSKMRGIPKEQIVTKRYEKENAERKNHLQDLQTQRNKAEKDLFALKTEVLACIKGESVLPRETLAEMITAQEEKLTELENLCEAASEELEKTAELMDKVSRLYDELISYADLYDSANFEAKKMIVNQLIRRVDVYRGYERWAKKHNLKEMSKTLLFLQEQKISSADELKELADAALSHYHELGDSIKAAEQRMTEIAVLRAHIVNYAKTRPVYDAYRKSGYSSKFLEAHREEITLHKAAKAAFNESGLKKLPKVKDLNAEYSALLTKKKALYPEYRKARDEMQDIVKAQKNVELFFAEEKDSKQVEQIR